MPRQVNYLKSKANALLLAGDSEPAAAVQKPIRQIDSHHYDANLFLGTYFPVKGQERLDSIDTRYLEEVGQPPVQASYYREAKREVLAADIAAARRYFTTAAQTRSNRYLNDQLARLDGLTDELPQLSGIVKPLLWRLKQE